MTMMATLMMTMMIYYGINCQCWCQTKEWRDQQEFGRGYRHCAQIWTLLDNEHDTQLWWPAGPVVLVTSRNTDKANWNLRLAIMVIIQQGWWQPTADNDGPLIMTDHVGQIKGSIWPRPVRRSVTGVRGQILWSLYSKSSIATQNPKLMQSVQIDRRQGPGDKSPSRSDLIVKSNAHWRNFNDGGGKLATHFSGHISSLGHLDICHGRDLSLWLFIRHSRSLLDFMDA